MKTILYTFADGHKEELEVTDEVAEVFYELEKYEQKVNRKETRRTGTIPFSLPHPATHLRHDAL